ncbi:MAG: TetR family transcriptional regulator C-terminal domain-containing protein [Defluviimonas sp.]|uniref:TetR/AcrR family transcriptional regulator n=1 Tax=Albidovulum sp. TaxID=1872424 RepID=UPI002A31F9FA|nr:TetR family transcriptional regulator C-terminal domain-containing protein [Defluviimonas sp.]
MSEADLPPPAARFTRMSAPERRAELVAAALACMARGGIQDFTVDRICAKAGVSRGLITHHFGSMNGLLAAVYGAMYSAATEAARAPAPGESRLSVLLDAFFAPAVFNRSALTVWLTLWGQIAVNAELRAAHRAHYARYLDDVALAINEVAAANGRVVDPEALARTTICLVDGLGIQHCVDPASMPARRAKAACRRLLVPQIGRF